MIKFLIIIMLGISLLSRPAEAHVLLTDNTGTIGAILHVVPDDDPIAGKQSTLFFDIQDQTFSKHAHTVSLKIVDEQGSTDVVPVKVIGSSVSATYIFPVQGAYRLELAASSKDTPTAHTHTFTHTQRVSRGVIGSALDQPSHAWAEGLLIASICAFLTLLIIGFNHKEEIARYSKW